MVSIAPPATTFYLGTFVPFWLDLDPRCKDIAAGLRAISTSLGTVHNSIFRVGRLLDQAIDLGLTKTMYSPKGAALAAVEDGEQVRAADPWLDGTKQEALTVVINVLKKYPPTVQQIQQMRAKIAGFNGGFGMVQLLFIGLRKGSNIVVFGASTGGGDTITGKGFVIRESGTLITGRGSGYIMKRNPALFEVEIMDWPDSYLMRAIDQLAGEGFELIGTPMVIMCPPMPSGYDDHLRWAERFIDDGLGMYVVV